MADQQPVGNPVPTNAIPIAAKDELGNLEYLTIDAAGSLNVNVGGALGSAVTIADGADVTEGAIADVKVVGDNSGTVSAKLRGINYLINLVVDTVNSWLKVHIDDGHDVNAGTTTDALIVGNDPGTLSGKLRGINYLLQQVVDATNLFVRTRPPVANSWTVTHVPATATQATATQAAGAGAVRNVCTGFTVTFAAGSTAPAAATPITVAVIDGATGGVTYLWRTIVCVPATANAIVSFNRSDLWLTGSAATAMTIEFSAAGGANTYQSVTMDGTKV